MNFHLEFIVTKDHRRAELIVSKTLPDPDFEKFKRIIDKAGDPLHKTPTLQPLAEFIKDEELNVFSKNEWKLQWVKFTITEDEMLEYYKAQGVQGGSPHHAHEVRFPHVEVAEISHVNSKLLINSDKIQFTSYFGKNGGYVLSSKYDAHQIRAQKAREKANSKPPFLKDADDTPVVSKPKIKLTKKECSACRTSIIEKATLSDMNLGGFTSEFVETLSEACQAYLTTLDSFKIKLMMNAVTKKFK